MYLKNLEKEHKNNTCRKKEVLKIRAEIVQLENWWFVEKLNVSKIWFFENTNKIDNFFFLVVEKERHPKIYIISKEGGKTTDREW